MLGNACPETWLYQYKGSAVVRTGGTAITLEEGCCCTVTSGALPRTPQERAKPVPAPEALGLELWRAKAADDRMLTGGRACAGREQLQRGAVGGLSRHQADQRSARQRIARPRPQVMTDKQPPRKQREQAGVYSYGS